MPEEHKTVFISYRRKVAAFIARAIFQDLREHDYDVFMDVESIDSGQFDQIILNQIEARAHFLIVLTSGTVERCIEPGDWLRQEIEYAIDHQRNIVPLIINDFSFDGTERYLTGKLSELSHYNGVDVPHTYFDAAMERLRTRFLKLPVYGVIMPTPASDQPEVDRKLEKIATKPTPTREELSAEDYFSRAFARDEKDIDGKIADYSETIRLNPQHADAYNNRGVEYQALGELDQALADYSEAIRLDPDYAIAYSNRGALREMQGDYNGAFADNDRAIRLDSRSTEAYYGRGGSYYHQGDLDAAIADFKKAIRLDADYTNAYVARGEAYFSKGDYRKALEDFSKANTQQPAFDYALAGLAISHYALGETDEAKRIWQVLLAQDKRYRDADWVGKQLNWVVSLIEAARKLIAEL